MSRSCRAVEAPFSHGDDHQRAEAHTLCNKSERLPPRRSGVRRRALKFTRFDILHSGLICAGACAMKPSVVRDEARVFGGSIASPPLARSPARARSFGDRLARFARRNRGGMSELERSPSARMIKEVGRLPFQSLERERWRRLAAIAGGGGEMTESCRPRAWALSPVCHVSVRVTGVCHV